jgi:hypothetical protein
MSQVTHEELMCLKEKYLELHKELHKEIELLKERADVLTDDDIEAFDAIMKEIDIHEEKVKEYQVNATKEISDLKMRLN